MRRMSYLDHEDDALAYERDGNWLKAMHAWQAASQATAAAWLKDRCAAMVEHCEKRLAEKAAATVKHAQTSPA